MRHVVRGVVMDSVSRVPLVGAVVQVTTLGSTARPHGVVTDSSGRFRVGDLSSGEYIIGFYHEALTALGLDAPLRSFAIMTDTAVTVDIGVPSGSTVYALRCSGDAPSLRSGMLAGFVRTAIGDSALTGASVAIGWRALALDSGNFRTISQQAVARVDGDGSYRLCGVPGDAPLTLRVTLPGYRAVGGPIQVPVSGVTRMDFRMVHSAADRGPASVRGRVVRENGLPVPSARATVAALAREVEVRDGVFTLANLPVGTWLVEVRAIGFEPSSAMIDANEHVPLSTTFTLNEHAQALDVVRVIGAPSRMERVLTDLLWRKRFGSGTVFLPGNSFLMGADDVSDVLRAARGFQSRGDGGYYGRARCNSIRLYMNGAIAPEGLEGIRHRLAMSEVLAVEAYPDIAFAPSEWRIRGGGNACAVVAVWTKSGLP
jgi:hypothetical protein